MSVVSDDFLLGRACKECDRDEKVRDTIQDIQHKAVEKYKSSQEARWKENIRLGLLFANVAVAAILFFFFGFVVGQHPIVGRQVVYRVANDTAAALFDIMSTTFAFETFSNGTGAFLKIINQG
jgi:hypothetical protein